MGFVNVIGTLTWEMLRPHRFRKRVLFSPKLAPFRSLVEGVIQRVKSYSLRATQKAHGTEGPVCQLGMMWRIACGLVDWRLGLAAPTEDESDGEYTLFDH